MGGGAFVVRSNGGKEEVESGIGDVATVWDSEVAGMAEGLDRARRGGERRILILADSKAAIAAVEKQAGREKQDLGTCKKSITRFRRGGRRGGRLQ